MLKKWMLTTLTLITLAALTSVAALAQDNAAPQPRHASGAGYHQFDIGGSFFKTFVSSTSGMGLTQTPSDGMGGLLEARYLVSPLLGFEVTLGVNSGGQAYAPITGACALTCQNPKVSIDGQQVQTSLNYVPSYKFGNLRAFLVGGLGVFVSVPGATPLGNITSIRGAYNYGGGLEYDISNHFGVRGQYRATMYKAPNISAIYPADGQYTQTGMPMGGIYYRF